jgi:hypothetical protein
MKCKMGSLRKDGLCADEEFCSLYEGTICCCVCQFNEDCPEDNLCLAAVRDKND